MEYIKLDDLIDEYQKIRILLENSRGEQYNYDEDVNFSPLSSGTDEDYLNAKSIENKLISKIRKSIEDACMNDDYESANSVVMKAAGFTAINSSGKNFLTFALEDTGKNTESLLETAIKKQAELYNADKAGYVSKNPDGIENNKMINLLKDCLFSLDHIPDIYIKDVIEKDGNMKSVFSDDVVLYKTLCDWNDGKYEADVHQFNLDYNTTFENEDEMRLHMAKLGAELLNVSIHFLAEKYNARMDVNIDREKIIDLVKNSPSYNASELKSDLLLDDGKNYVYLTPEPDHSVNIYLANQKGRILNFKAVNDDLESPDGNLRREILRLTERYGNDSDFFLDSSKMSEIKDKNIFLDQMNDVYSSIKKNYLNDKDELKLENLLNASDILKSLNSEKQKMTFKADLKEITEGLVQMDLEKDLENIFTRVKIPAEEFREYKIKDKDLYQYSVQYKRKEMQELLKDYYPQLKKDFAKSELRACINEFYYSPESAVARGRWLLKSKSVPEKDYPEMTLLLINTDKKINGGEYIPVARFDNGNHFELTLLRTSSDKKEDPVFMAEEISGLSGKEILEVMTEGWGRPLNAIDPTGLKTAEECRKISEDKFINKSVVNKYNVKIQTKRTVTDRFVNLIKKELQGLENPSPENYAGAASRALLEFSPKEFKEIRNFLKKTGSSRDNFPTKLKEAVDDYEKNKTKEKRKNNDKDYSRGV